MRQEVQQWWQQALDDLETATISFENKRFYACSFWCQQASEKALKALYLEIKKEPSLGHGLVFLAKSTNAPRDIIEACAVLNPEYAISRYPDAAAGVPSEIHTKELSGSHYKKAEVILTWVKQKLLV